MKLRSFLFTTALVASFLGSHAQVATPEFKNKVFNVNKDNALSELDNTDLQTEYKAKMTGSGKVLLKASGATSGIKNPEEHFVVKIEAGTDPSEVVELFKFDVQKNGRSITVSTLSSLGQSQNVELPKQKLKFTKLQDGVWEITAAEKLPSGEYFFIVNRPNIDVVGAAGGKSMKGYCFSVAG
jgi:hypothetical protein